MTDAKLNDFLKAASAAGVELRFERTHSIRRRDNFHDSYYSVYLDARTDGDDRGMEGALATLMRRLRPIVETYYGQTS